AGVDVVDGYVEHRVSFAALGRRSDAAADIVAQVDHPVVHRVVGVDVPVEELGEEALQLAGVTTGDFEPDSHRVSFQTSIWGRGPGSPPTATIARRGRYRSQPCACASTAGAGRSRCMTRTSVPSPSAVSVTSTVLEPGVVQLSSPSQPPVNTP